jgi:hypothetical protein
MPFLGIFALLGRLVPSPAQILDFLKSPVGIVLMIGIAYFVGDYRGRHKAEAICQEQMRASVEAAKSIDTKALEQQLANAREQQKAAEARAVAGDQRLKEFADAIKDDCEFSPDELDRLNSLGGVQPNSVPSSPPNATPR